MRKFKFAREFIPKGYPVIHAPAGLADFVRQDLADAE